MITNMRIAVALLVASSSLLSAREEGAALALLKKPDATLEQRQEACRQLALIGTAKSVPVLAGLLTEPELSQMARHALEPIPDPIVDAVLRDALGTVKGRLLIGVINSVGVRGDEQAAPALGKFLGDSDAEVAEAAALALGKIGTMEAVQVLQSQLEGASPILLPAVCEGLLRGAALLADKGGNDDAFAVDKRLLAFPKASRQVRAAALREAVHTDGKAGLILLVDALRGDDDAMFSAAVRISMEMERPEVTQALAAEMVKLSAERQVLLAGVLAERGDPAGGPVLVKLLDSAGTPVRIAAAKALTRLAYKAAVPMLSKLALDSNDDLKAVARECLAGFPDESADAAVTKFFLNDDPEVRRVGTELIALRRSDLAAPALLKVAAKDEVESVRVAALTTLRELGDVGDLEALIEIVLNSKSGPVTQAATHALVVVCTRHPAVDNEPAPECVDPLVAALEKASGPAKAALITVLRRVGGTKAGEAVRRAEAQ